MITYKNWLDNEMLKITATLDNIPSHQRKGYDIAVHRMRARDLKVAIDIFAEYELNVAFNSRIENLVLSASN